MKGERVKNARGKIGLTGKDLAEVLKVAPSTVSRWETGEAEPNDDQKEKLAQLLGVSIGYLMGEELLKEPVVEIPLYSMSDLTLRPWNNGVRLRAREAVLVMKADVGEVDVEKRAFAVLAEGDGMASANIPQGARVVINPGQTVLDGDVALVQYGGVFALKWVFWRGDGGVEIRSASPLYPSKVFEKEDLEKGSFEVIGKVMGVYIKPLRAL